jgi:glycosyltransferase involved in cell wall biosynthesis
MMLKSVYDQLWDNIELIMVNDGATDGTREKLSEWEERFRQRRYEVIIVDQENQGIPGAVKSGLLRITGEYVCLVDCDDMLDREYVSTMAEWLEKHREHEWVACTYNGVKVKDGRCHEVVLSVTASEIPSPPNMIEKYLSALYTNAIWIYMARVNYLKKCNVIDRFITDIRATQEPGFLFPLAIGNGALHIVDRPLYKHNSCYSGRTSVQHSIKGALTHLGNYAKLIKRTIETLDANALQKKKWSVMAEFEYMRLLFPSIGTLNDGSEYLPIFAEKAASLISKHFNPNPCITTKQIIDKGYEMLSIAITDCILRIEPTTIPEIKGRVVGCGALGTVGKRLVPELIGSPLEPTELWDASASKADYVSGKPVTNACYDSLTPEDVVLIFPNNHKVKTEIYDIVLSHGVKRILVYDDIQAIAPSILYPQFYGKCVFEVEEEKLKRK